MKITFDEVRAGYPPEKRKSDTLWAKIIIRQLSLYLAWVAIRVNISAFTVSVVSLLLPITAMYFWLTSAPLVAIIMLMVWILLDCVDGGVARATGGTQMGAFVDAASGYAMIGFSFFGLGAYLDIAHPDFFPHHMAGFTLMGATMSILNLLARLYYQKFLNVLNDASSGGESGLSGVSGIIKYVDKNLGVGGFFTPILLIAYYVDFLIPIFILYGIYSLLYFIGIGGMLLKRARN